MCVESVCVGCVLRVWRGLARGKNLCVGSKRLRVYRQNALMCYHMRAFCGYTRKRFEPTHGDVLNLHTERRERGGVIFYLSSSSSIPSFYSLSLFLSLPLLYHSLSLSSFSSLFSLLSSLSATMTMIARPVGSLCTHGSDLP